MKYRRNIENKYVEKVKGIKNDMFPFGKQLLN